MDKKIWKILTIIFIIITIIISGFFIIQIELIKNFELNSPECFIYGENNVRSCGIGCYIKGYRDSHIIEDPTLKPECYCSYPFNESAP